MTPKVTLYRHILLPIVLAGLTVDSSAAPNAVNDTYSVNEDLVLAVSGAPLVEADFEAGSPINLGNWDFLDRIENEIGDNDSYPSDGGGNAWNSAAFNTATSTVTPWSNAAMPMQSGNINAFGALPDTLFGLDEGPNQENIIATYLFRNTFNVTAGAAGATTWTARALIDDGCIIYVDGVEVARSNMPPGTPTSNTLTGTSGNEDSYQDFDIGPLTQGSHTIAVELHQADLFSSDIGIDLQLVPGGTSTDGFVYADDVFGTSLPNNAEGFHDPTGGITGGGVYAHVGGSTPPNNRETSAGWVRQFDLTSPATVTVTLSYRLLADGSYENDEWSAAVLNVDGVNYGNDAGSTLVLLNGDGNNGPDLDSGWVTESFTIPLGGGAHTLIVGVFNNKSTTAAEVTDVWFDDIIVSIGNAGVGVGGVLANDTGDAATLVATLVSNPSNGNVVFSGDGTFEYTPNENYFGNDSFVYRATDNTGNDTATVNITVLPVNDPPVGVGNAYSVSEDTTLAIPVPGVLGNDTDLEDDTLNARLQQAPSNGGVTLNPGGSFVYIPDPDFFGSDDFTYIANDGGLDSAPTAVTITVTEVPDPPIGVPDSYTMDENTTLLITQAQPSGGGGGSDVTLLATGSMWRYRDNGSNQGTAWRAPAFNDNGWQQGAAELGYGDGDEATEVRFGPDPDNSNNDPNDKFATTYFRSTFSVTDPAVFVSATVSLKFDDGAAVYLNGTEIIRENLPSDAAFDTYTGANAPDELSFFDFPVDPALLVAGTNTLAIEIHQISPTSSDISMDLAFVATRNDNLGVLANDSDPDSAILTATVSSPPPDGNLSLNPNGTFTYTPDPNYSGTDTFFYRVSDGGLTSAPVQVTITIVNGDNDVPEPLNDSYNGTEDNAIVVNAANGVLDNDDDPDNDPMTAVLDTPPSSGGLVLNPNGSFIYTPVQDFEGVATFTYFANDGTANSAPATVTLTLAPVNDPPVAANDSYATAPGQTLAVSVANGVLDNDDDVDGDTLTAALVADVSDGSLTLNPTGSFVYIPDGGFSGIDSFTYRANDGTVSSATVTVSIDVNIPPNASPDSYSTSEDVPLSVNAASGVLDNDSDPTNDPLVAVLVSTTSNGTLALNPNGSFTYTPNPDFAGSDSFVYRASDGSQQSNAVAVSITIDAVNDAPDANDDDYFVLVDQPLTVGAAEGVLANDSDVESPTLSAAEVTPPANGTLDLAPNGSFTYTPNPGFAGGDSFVYSASDGSLTDTATATINVNAGANAVVINEIMYHPQSENVAEEFIELHNVGSVALDLAGWSFTSGVQFTFPSVVIPAGGFLVVAADTTIFTATYGAASPLVGGWNGTLSNRGERIRIIDSTGAEADDITYSDQGEWATRVQTDIGGEDGWDWYSDHDGFTESLELILPSLTNKQGQNWAASSGGPTPGAANSAAAADIAPMITKVKHDPAVPSDANPVTISCELRDAEGSTLSATLHYRESTSNPDAFATAAMTDTGGGDFESTLPTMPNGTVVEFYISATDGTLSRTWPAPTDAGQLANCHYQVDNEVAGGDIPVYRIVMTVDDDNQYSTINRGSNAFIHCTLIADDCSGPDIRYLCGIRVRGASSRSHTPPPMRLNIPRDNDWEGLTRMNLNSKYTYMQFIGYKLFQASGLAAPNARRVQVRRNGADHSRNDEFDYGSWVHAEPLQEEFLAQMIPNDDNGNLYKKVRPDVDWAWRDGDFGQYPSDGWGKQTNASENDWSDLDTFLGVMDNAPGSPTYVQQVESVANLDQWMKWFGVMTIIANGETNASNGADDDYSMYRGVNDQRFIFLPHDLDTILSIGDGSRITDPEATLFDMIEPGANGRNDILDPLVPLFENSGIVTRYYEAMRELLQTTFSRQQFNELLDNHLGGWVPQNVIGDIQTFMDARRTFIETEIESLLGPAPPITAPTTDGVFTSVSGALRLNEILAVNQTAYANGATFPDAIELFNGTASAINVGNFTLTDDPAVPDRYVIPAGTTITAGGYLVVHADSDPVAPGLHAGFSLEGNGESVYFYTGGGTLLDSLEFGLQIADYSVGRVGAGTDWALTQPTLGAANTPVAYGSPATMRINEWLALPDLTYEDDFVELYNPDPNPVPLGGLFITDEPVAVPQRFVMPQLSFIAGSSFSVFEPKGSSASPGNATELPFKLSSGHGWLSISGSNGVEIDEIHYLCETLDVSQGRSPDAGPDYADFSLPTPGLSNSTDLSAEIEVLQSLRIVEIMYHPPLGSEYLVLENIGNSAISLDGVRFTEGISFDFTGVVVPAGGQIVIAQDTASYQAQYGTGIPIAGQYTGRLDNGGERLRLEIVGILAGILDFDYNDSWYPQTDGLGTSLQIINKFAPRNTWGMRASWNGGSLGGFNGWVAANFTSSDPLVIGPDADPDCDLIPNYLEYAFLTDPNSPNDTLPLEVAVNAGGFLTLTYPRNALATDLSYTAEYSTDLENWESSAIFVVESLVAVNGNVETWRARSTTTLSQIGRAWLRVNVTGQ